MITLAIFALFNRTLIYSFYFKNANENVLSILDKAIDENNPNLILNSIPTDIMSVSQFLFILYAMVYVYSKLSEFASTYGGSFGKTELGIKVGNVISKAFKTTVATVLSTGPESAKYVKEDAKKKEANEKITEVKQEEEITNA